MKRLKNKQLLHGTGLLIAFSVWTVLILFIDVRPIGPKGSSVGFAALNAWFHDLTGVHMPAYTITDWLGLVPIVICLLGIVYCTDRYRNHKDSYGQLQ